MQTLESSKITLRLGADGRTAIIADRLRGEEWQLDPSRQTFRRRGTDGKPGPAEPFPDGRVERLDGALLIRYDLGDGEVQVRWELAEDHVRLVFTSSSDSLEFAALPGAFRPVTGQSRLLVPVYQGLLYLGGDDPWEESKPGGAHGNFSLSMAAALTDRGALLATIEDLADWTCLYGDDAAGPFFTFQVERCPINGWRKREVRLYPTDPDITAIAKRYRARIQERGEFVSWEEKIAKKPILENLFGALMAFIGYNKTSEVDYIGSARKLAEMGFEHVLYFPVRMCHYSLDFHMGGDTPIWLSDEELRQWHEIPGAMLGPWGWFVEGLEDGSERMAKIFRRNPEGNTYNHWRVEDQQWKEVCPPYQVEESKRRLAGDMAAMDWIHYDVNATRLGRPRCFSTDHALHDHRPMDKPTDVGWIRRLLGPETNGNRIVSSEGFQDRFAVSYDIGTTKIIPDFGNTNFVPVPLTSLVLHDSCLHDWWELANYNSVPGFPAVAGPKGIIGSGYARKKAAMDALHGCPPNLFPFGRQYSWSDIGAKRTFSFTVQLADREVQRALEVALPLTKLHKRIGKQELLSFEFLSADRTLQATTFADGTRIIANLGRKSLEAPGVGLIAPDSWREDAR